MFRENPEKTFMLTFVFGIVLIVGGVAVLKPINPEPEQVVEFKEALPDDHSVFTPEGLSEQSIEFTPVPHDCWILPDGVIDSLPPGPEGRDHYLYGVEVEGTYWWFCDGEWIEIDPPCKEVP